MIEGITITPHFITGEEEAALLALADAGAWKPHPHGKRDQKFYADFPALWLAERMGLGDPYRLIISAYEAGEGMVAHSDVEQQFPIVGGIVSLLASSEWVFSRGAFVHRIIVPPRSLFVFRGPARYEWQHAVTGIESRRVSFYFSFEEKA
jgi:alkylated DNA repair dioxygenase AlkB